MYLKEISPIPLLTAGEEVGLAKRIEAGRLAREGMMKKGVSDGKRGELRIAIEDGWEARQSLVRGQKDILCKHMVAVTLTALKGGKSLTKEETTDVGGVNCSNKLGQLTDEELTKIKQSISEAMRCIKSYTGPSRIWFRYQSSLTEGANRLAAIFSGLPVGYPASVLLVEILLRLDKKLVHGGVDDSDGTIGGLIEEGVKLLQTFAKLDPTCVKAFELLKNQHTCFDWEKQLI